MTTTLYRGDCLDLMDYIPDGSVDMAMCDPPYGTTRNRWDSVIPPEPMWRHLKRIVKPNGAILLCSQDPFTSFLITSNPKLFRYKWVWEKTAPTGHLNANRMPMKWFEEVCCFYQKLPTYNPQLRAGKGYRSRHCGQLSSNYGSQRECVTPANDGTQYKPKDIIGPFCNSNGAGKLHPTQKPVALMEYMIKTYTNEGETVLDFAMGSGTTGVACANLDRNFIGIELDDAYFEIAKQRITAAEFSDLLA